MTQPMKINSSGAGDTSRREYDRAPVDAEVFVRQRDTRLFRATLSNLSLAGFRLNSWTQLDPQQLVLLSLPGMQLLSARIRWHDRNEYGCEFTDTLHPAVLEHLIRQLNGL